MPTLFIEAFGSLSGPPTIDADEEDLYSLFYSLGELMRWSVNADDSPALWALEEAEVTADTHPGRIGLVQVGLTTGRLNIGADWPVMTSSEASMAVSLRGGWYGGLPDPRKATDPAIALPALAQCFCDFPNPLRRARHNRHPANGAQRQPLPRRGLSPRLSGSRTQLVQHGCDADGSHSLIQPGSDRERRCIRSGIRPSVAQYRAV